MSKQKNVLKKYKYLILPSLLIIIFTLVPLSSIYAHSPVYTGENHNISDAYKIEDFTKSWVIYATLGHPDHGDYYKFEAKKGERIYINLMTAESPESSGFLPSFALLIPDSDKEEALPSYIDIPEDWGIDVINGKDPGVASYEPFTPGWLYDLASISTDAPKDGTYYIVVFDDSQKTGNYSLAVGFIESFTLAEWIMIPYAVHRTYAWEGQNIFVTYLPILLTIIIGTAILIWLKTKKKGPEGLSKWLSAFAGITFLGTSFSVLYQMIKSLSTTGFALSAIVTLIIAGIGILLSVLTLSYALRKKQRLTINKRILLGIIGIISIFSWSGFFIGTFLAISAAAVPPYRKTNK